MNNANPRANTALRLKFTIINKFSFTATSQLVGNNSKKLKNLF